jgi:hypothetical protein
MTDLEKFCETLDDLGLEYTSHIMLTITSPSGSLAHVYYNHDGSRSIGVAKPRV